MEIFLIFMTKKFTVIKNKQNIINLYKLTPWVGMIGSALFVVAFIFEGWFQSEYRPISMFVSELSLGPWGWIQITNFIITGILIFLFGRGVATHFLFGKEAKAGPILLQIIGVSLVASGFFVTDSSALFNQHSVHGIIHGLFGAVVFSLAPTSCFVFFRRFQSNKAWQGFAWWTLIIGLFLVIGIVFLKVSEFPQNSLFMWKGLIQRFFLIAYMTWIFTFSRQLQLNNYSSQ